MGSCSKFLEESSQDLLIPKSVKDYKEFLYGEGLNRNAVLHPYLDVMTDDVGDAIYTERNALNNDTREPVWSYYTWQAFPEVGKNNELTADVAWNEYYHKILISNIILKNIPEMSGTADEKDDLSAEAHFLRGWSYFMLANLYGKPYRAASAATDFCVPINTETGVEDKMPQRESVARIYEQIDSDIKTAIALFKASGLKKTIFRPNLATAYLMASRVALFTENYDECVKYADSVTMSTNATLADLNVMNLNPAQVSGQTPSYFFSISNPEILFSLGKYTNVTYRFDYKYKGALTPSDSLIKLYVQDKDLRAKQYFAYTNSTYRGKTYIVYEPRKVARTGATVFANNFRLSEAYLNKAEALARMDNVSEAQATLNELRSKRFATDYDYSLTLSGKEDAIAKAIDERRMELAFEGFRWFDLRRYGCPKIEHKYTGEPSSETYRLDAGSVSYILPLPKSERDRNLIIEKVNRPASNPVSPSGPSVP